MLGNGEVRAVGGLHEIHPRILPRLGAQEDHPARHVRRRQDLVSPACCAATTGSISPADYRIGTRYLDEPILDLIKQQAMQVPFLRELLRNDWIDIRNNIKIQDLGPVLSFVGKLGDPDSRRHVAARIQPPPGDVPRGEIAAMQDVPEFIRKAQEIYGYDHFVNDVGGSLCELEDAGGDRPAGRAHADSLHQGHHARTRKTTLIRRAQSDPKPLYFRPAFLAENLPQLHGGTRPADHRRRPTPTTSRAGCSRTCSTRASRATRPSPARTATPSPRTKWRR